MHASTYQQLAARTLIDRPGFELSDTDLMIIWNALGLAGEAGEVCEAIKKGILHQHGLDKSKLHKELGDVCWYLAALCTKLGFDLGDVMEANIAKLRERYPNGYNPADSMARVDTVLELNDIDGAPPTPEPDTPRMNEVYEDYLAWIRDQPWPDGATHVTMDKSGGTCWWIGRPRLRPESELGWEGELAERYYDPAQSYSCDHWPESERRRPTLPAASPATGNQP